MSETKPDCEFCSNGHALSTQCPLCLVCARAFGEPLGAKFKPVAIEAPVKTLPAACGLKLSEPCVAPIRMEDCEQLFGAVYAQMNGDELTMMQIIERMESLAGRHLTRANSGTPMRLVLSRVGMMLDRHRSYRAPTLYSKIKT